MKEFIKDPDKMDAVEEGLRRLHLKKQFEELSINVNGPIDFVYMKIKK